MGYLSQKKKFARESVFLQAMLVILCLFELAALLSGASAVNSLMFQAYIASWAVFGLALFLRRPLFSLFFALLVVINYFQIAASANLFFNHKVKAPYFITMVYSPENPLEIEAANAIVLRRGHLELEQGIKAPFLDLEKSGRVFTIVQIDLERVSAKERGVALQKLQHFVSEQDDPVIVFGDFGVTAWSAEMKKFLADTRLEVKNRLLFTGRGSSHKYLSAPGFYVLSFKNIGLRNLEVEAPKNEDAYPRVQFRLGFY